MADTINITVKIYDKQQQFLNSRALFRGFAAGIGSGKSWIGAYDLIRKAKPNRLYMVVAPTYTLMADASFRSVEQIALKLNLVDYDQIKRGKPPSMRLKTGAEILFRSGDEPDMLRGPNLSGVWLDEASLMNKDVFDVMIGRLRENELGWLTATFTPQGKSHWTYKQFATGLEDTFLVHARTDENPFLPDRFMETRRRQYTSKQAQQELEGVFLDSGGNHFAPGLWPRYWQHAQNAWSVKLSDQMRHVYVKDECRVLIGFDLALNKPNRKKIKTDATYDKTDFCCFGAAALTPDGNLLMLDCINERMKIEAKAPMLNAFCRRWRPFMVASDEDMIAENLMLEFRRQRDIPEIRLLPFKGKNKVERATAAIIRGENGLIFLPEKAESGRESEAWVEVFSDNLASFTGVDDEHDDVADMIGIIGRLADDLKGEEHSERDGYPEVFMPGPDVFSPTWRR